jgi:RimJ/RimL family protein N-acetyltransferase
VSEIVPGDGFRLRRATPDDADFYAELASHEDVEPYLAVVRAHTREDVQSEIEQSLAEPKETGRFVIEVDQDGEWQRAGVLGYDVANRRSRIAHLGGLAVHPDFRGRHLSDEAASVL